MWDFSRYNVIVQQVEGCSDLLREAADRIEAHTGADPSGVAGCLLGQLRLTVDELDRRALAMLSFYDPYASALIKAGVVRDPRRGEWRRKSPPAERRLMPLPGSGSATPADVEGGVSQKPRGFKRAKRLKAGR